MKKRLTIRRVLLIPVCVALTLPTACQAPPLDRISSEDNDDQANNKYAYSKRMSGLDETVIVEKQPTGARCIRADGRTEPCAQTFSDDKAAYVNRFGNRSRELDAKLLDMPDTEMIRLNVFYTVDEPRELHSDDASVRSAARRRFVSELGHKRSEISQAVEDTGGEVLSFSKFIPWGQILAKKNTIQALAQRRDIAKLSSDPNREPREENGLKRTKSTTNKLHGFTDMIPSALISGTFYESAFYGNRAHDQKIGVLGYDGGGCGLWGDHNTLDEATIVNFEPPNGCVSNNDCDCNGNWDAFPPQAVCIYGKCYQRHETQVASVIAAGHMGAGEATYYHYNHRRSGEQDVVCYPENVDAAYEWFLENDVTIVNESFSCYELGWPGHSSSGARLVDGFVQDYYSRIYDILVVRAAGNDRSENASSPACDTTANAICVGGLDDDTRVSCLSNVGNPTDSDREEPDVVAYSGNGGKCTQIGSPVGTWVASLDNDAQYVRSNGGTSFAAPHVTRMAALYRERCPQWGGLRLRNWIMQKGWFYNPEGTNYSSPIFVNNTTSTLDQRDGAGGTYYDIPDCGSNSTGAMFDLTDGEPAPFTSGCGECGFALPVVPANEVTIVSKPIDNGISPNDYRLYRKLGSFQNFERLRFVFSWQSCQGLDGPSPAVPATDFDLLLMDGSSSSVLYASQRIDDNNEGFDADFGHWFANHAPVHSADVWVSWPMEAVGCAGDGFEQVAWSWYTW